MFQKKIGKMCLYLCALTALVMCWPVQMAHAIATPPATNLVEWFRADAVIGVANGGAVPTWVDQAAGGGSQTATAAGTTPTLVLNSANGLPALDFAGPATGGRYVTSGSPGITATGGSVYVMVVATDTFNNSTNFADRTPGNNPLMTLHANGTKFALQKRFDDGSGLADVLSTSNINTSGAYQIVTWRRNTSTAQFEIYVNGNLEGTAAAPPGSGLTPDAPVIGGHASFGGTSLDGRVAEFMVYNDSLSNSDLQNLHSYLDNKYFGQPYQPIAGLFNTGVNNAAAPLADNASDPHYVLNVNPDGTGPTPVVEDSTVFPIVGPWLDNSATSKWIGPRFNTVASAAGDYEYTLTFSLDGMDENTASISGSWATDNNGLDILINGVSTSLTNPNQFGSLTPFLITSGFVDGTNTLKFRLNNSSAGYTGLRVENLQGLAQIVAEIEVSGLGQDIANGDITPSLLDGTDFGAVFQGAVATQTFTIENTGLAELLLSSFSISGDFSLLGLFPTSIAAGDSATFDILMDTSTEGLKFGTISFATNDIDGSLFTFDLTGNVLVPEPATATLALLGLGGLMMRRRRMA